MSLLEGAHSTTTELLNNVVMPDGLADHLHKMLPLWNGQVNESDGA